MIVRGLLVLLAIDAIVCGAICLRQMQKVAVPLPRNLQDDSLYAAELDKLARAARDGGSKEWLSVAQALVGHGHYDHALACYRQASELDPKNLDAVFGLGFCLERTGHLEESNQVYSKLHYLVSDQGPQQRLGLFSLYDTGKNQLRMELPEEALATFGQISNFLPADYQRAKLLLRAGKVESALAVIEPPLREFPQSKEFRFLEHRALVAQEKFAEAKKSAELLERSQTAIRINFAPEFIHNYRIMYGYDRVFEEYSKIVDRGNNDRMAAKLEELRPFVQGKQIPQYKALLLNLAQVEVDRRRPDAVLKCVDELHAFGVENAHLLWLEGAALEMKGEKEKAIELWERSLRMSPNPSLEARLKRVRGG